jgi:hypothetical protein
MILIKKCLKQKYNITNKDIKIKMNELNGKINKSIKSYNQNNENNDNYLFYITFFIILISMLILSLFSCYKEFNKNKIYDNFTNFNNVNCYNENYNIFNITIEVLIHFCSTFENKVNNLFDDDTEKYNDLVFICNKERDLNKNYIIIKTNKDYNYLFDSNIYFKYSLYGVNCKSPNYIIMMKENMIIYN